MKSPPKPFLRWAGGKRWLGHALSPIFRKCEGVYYEPFLGSGSIFFASLPNRSYLSDLNKDLITLYEVVKSDPKEIRTALSSMECSKKNYYLVRDLQPKDPIGIASRLLFLNKTSFNGLYRVNKKGVFNVPFGDRNTKSFLDSDQIENASEALEHSVIRNSDFAFSISRASDGDIVYCDPAYTVKHNNNGFLRYNENVFSWLDQIRLRECSMEAMERGATVVISNAMHQSITHLYSPFKPIELKRNSNIGSISSRGVISESLTVLTRNSSLRKSIKSALNQLT